MHDLLIRNGTIYDGSGGAPVAANIAIDGDTITAIGPATGPARQTIDAEGLAVAPGFINLMCWANASLLHDGRSQSDIRQGVTLEILGEGWSMGPLNDELKVYTKELQGDIRYDIEWTTLREYLEYLVRRGVSTNVASFVGAGGVFVDVSVATGVSVMPRGALGDSAAASGREPMTNRVSPRLIEREANVLRFMKSSSSPDHRQIDREEQWHDDGG